MKPANPLFSTKIEIRYYVKIRQGTQQALAKIVYYRNNLHPDLFFKWKWYFEYRYALFRVKNPKMFCEFDYGAYQFELESDIHKKKLKNLITAKKRKISELNCKIQYAKDNWNELFPIEQNPYWTKVQDKLKRLIDELNTLMIEMSEYD